MKIEALPLDDPRAAPLVAAYMQELADRYPEEGNGTASDAKDFAPPHGTFLVAFADGKAAACGGVRQLDARTAEIKRMYVEPWARGRGLARKMLGALEDAARGLGYASVRLEAGERQPEALGLYESSGYNRIAPYGEFRDSPLTVSYEKELRG